MIREIRCDCSPSARIIDHALGVALEAPRICGEYGTRIGRLAVSQSRRHKDVSRSTCTKERNWGIYLMIGPPLCFLFLGCLSLLRRQEYGYHLYLRCRRCGHHRRDGFPGKVYHGATRALNLGLPITLTAVKGPPFRWYADGRG